ncbi:hypothetical protein GGE50_002745 [Rhizobium leguminosarum]|nr:hypothetical protein [Rhizobium leguminosarum]MDH6658696.1 hypothetical protein [Rhizobium sophorae]MBB4342472.1 hypothetical protein [Rhizobium leguminosarum]MBB4354248.1 hypothetical protein [Rhizobium leguminosarum]MBB4388024.1 hypothetical protein [Rhizobium leguminosarum]
MKEDIHQLAEGIAHIEAPDAPRLVGRAVLDREA